MKTLRIALAVAAMLSLATSAFALGKGQSTFSIQIGTGAADLIGRSAPGEYITASPQVPELEPRLEFTKMIKDDYAFNFGVGLGFYSETDKPGDANTPGSPDRKTTVSSFFVRVGGDRVVNVGDRTTLYFGPGVEYWSGKYKFEVGSLTDESESTMRISLAGRIGGTMMLNESFGFTCNASHRIGIASAEWDGAKANWTPSSTGASGGLLFVFGGN